MCYWAWCPYTRAVIAERGRNTLRPRKRAAGVIVCAALAAFTVAAAAGGDGPGTGTGEIGEPQEQTMTRIDPVAPRAGTGPAVARDAAKDAGPGITGYEMPRAT